MPFNSLISRTDAAALIPEDVSREIIEGLAEMNPLMRLARRLPNMSRAQTRLPVMSALATAYFVSGDTGLVQSSEVNWANKYIDAEEVAAIVPIPKKVIADADYDLWAETRPELLRACDVAITTAALFGTNVPASWTTNLGGAGLFAGATAAGHVVSRAAYADDYEAILGETAAGVAGLFMAVEADGYGVTGSIAHMSMKGKLRNLRDANGNPIFKTSPQSSTQYELDGGPLVFPTDGTINPATALMMSGQWDQLVWAIRSDVEFEIATEGIIQDAAGNIVYNLFQQSMVALKVTMRLGFALPNPINRMNSNAATRFPFGFLTA